MSYARFGSNSDVYVYHDVDFHLRCCGCSLQGDYDTEWYDHMLEHLKEHAAKGHKVSVACTNLLHEAREGGGSEEDKCCK